jgi:predicted GNAT family acetyltransferase
MVEPNADWCFSPSVFGLLHPISYRRARLNGVDDIDREPTGSAENIAVQDNPGESRYELLLDEQVVGEILYRSTPDHLVLLHTEVLPSLEGKGLGARLVAGALDDIRACGQRVVPFCPFVRAYIRRHPEYTDLVVRHVEVRD